MIASNNNTPLTKNMLLYLKGQSVCCKDSTLGAYKIGLRHFSHFMESCGLTVENLVASDISAFLQHICSLKLAPYTRLNYFLIVRKYLAWEVDSQRVSEKILEEFVRSKLPKVPEYLPRPLGAETDLELQRRCQISRTPYALMFLLLRNTGLRISELINLPFDPLVTLNKATFLKVPLGKMNTERMVPLSTQTIEIIRKIQKAYPICPNQCSKQRLIGLTGSISTVRGHLYYHYKKITAEMTDQNHNITFHRLRHTYATTLLSAGVSIVSIMKLLGHRRIEMSLRYAKVTPNHLRDEYLKAVAVIENQAGIQVTTTKTKSADWHPSEIIEHLRAFTNKAAKLDARNKKNILRKITRLKIDIAAITFDQKFKMTDL